MNPTLRTFIAVEIDEAVRRAAVGLVDQLRTAAADVTWVAPHNMHLTVKFLGDVATEKIPQVCDWVAKAVAGVESFDLQIRGAGAFPNLTRPRTIWLGSEAGHKELAAVAERIEAALEGLGFAPEGRAFRGHLTLGRVRRPTPALAGLTQLLQGNSAFEAGIAPIDHVVVFSSQLGPKGPTYEALARAPFESAQQ
jgi:RNA 2',3'-cyclic 3'-phosphodiesterase